jgi:hypothetical protein
VPDEQSAEVGGLQNTATNLGASLGTALVGSILMGTLASSMISGILANPDIPDSVKQSASVELAAGIPFISDAQLEAALEAEGVPPDIVQEAVEINADARLDGLRTALAAVVLVGIIALFFTPRIPTVPPGRAEEESAIADAPEATPA